MNPFQLLMQQGSQQYTDDGGPLARALAYHQMIQQRQASAFRNVGPQNLFAAPDRNTIMPDDVTSYRMTPGEERI